MVVKGDPKRVGDGQWTLRGALTTGLILLGVGAVITLGSLYIGFYQFTDGLFATYLTNLPLLLLNALPILFSLLLVFALSSSLRIAVFANAVFWGLLAVFNAVKVTYRHESLCIDDVYFLGPMVKIMPRYLQDLLPLLVAVGLGVVLLASLSRHLPKVPKLPRLVAGGLVVLLLVTGFAAQGNYKTWEKAFYLGEVPGLNNWVGIDNDASNGFPYSFIYQSYAVLLNAHQPVDEALAREVLQGYQAMPMVEEQKVNVLVVLLESFKDFSDLGMVGLEERDPYAYFHSLQKEAITGDLVPDVFGGSTTVSELEVLSGFSMTIMDPSFRWPRPTYVSFFKDQGYATEAMHPNDGYFYNRINVLPNVGFEKFFYTQNYFKNKEEDGFYADKALFNHVFNRVQGAEKPLFHYTATMQNHGPYADLLAADSWCERPEGISEEDFNAFQAYLEGVADTGQVLWDFTRRLDNLDKPVVVVAFGDHSPGFSNTFFNKMGFIDPKDQGVLKNIQLYKTPYLIWGNESAKARLNKDFSGSFGPLDPELLLAKTMGYMGVTGSPYQAFLQDYAQAVPVAKKRYCYENGAYQLAPSKEATIWIEKKEAAEGFTRRQKVH